MGRNGQTVPLLMGLLTGSTLVFLHALSPKAITATMRRERLRAVTLVQVEVVGPHPAQGGLDALEDVLAGEPAVVGVLRHGKEALGLEYHLRARDRAQGASQYLFGGVNGRCGRMNPTARKKGSSLDARRRMALMARLSA